VEIGRPVRRDKQFPDVLTLSITDCVIASLHGLQQPQNLTLAPSLCGALFHGLAASDYLHAAKHCHRVTVLG
jgi:hypothetical protein